MDNITKDTLSKMEKIDAPMKEYREVFRQLSPLPAEQLKGSYNQIPLGSVSGTKFWMLSIIIAGLPGIQGKEFDQNGEGFNLCYLVDGIKKIGPIYIAGVGPSIIDGKPSLIIRYRSKRYMIDELRFLDENTLMGMGYFKFGFIHSPGYPFLLKKGFHENGYKATKP